MSPSTRISSSKTARISPITTEAATPCPTTSPTASTTRPSGSPIASNQSPPDAVSDMRYSAAIAGTGQHRKRGR